MKNKWFVSAFSVFIALNISFSAYAAEIDQTEETNQSFYTVLKQEQKEGAEQLTLENAVEKAVKYASSVRNSKRELELLQKNRDELAEQYTNSVYQNNQDNFSILNSLLQYDTNLANSTLSQSVQEESVKYAMKKAYVGILDAEREIVLKKMSAANSEKELAVAEKKQQLGLITEKELETQRLSYEKSITDIENQNKSVDSSYVSLNVLLGEDTEKEYQLSLSPDYEEFVFKGDLESYINVCLSSNSNLMQKKNSLEYAEERLNRYSTADGDSYKTLENNVSTASLAYRDAKANLEKSIRSTYDSITTLEKSYENNLKELSVLKGNLDVAEKKYELKLLTDIELENARLAVASMESTILGQIYEHMLLVEQFNNSDLLSI